MSNLLWFRDISMSDLPQVGGKNASLGEMVSRLHGVGVRVPGGFATTAGAYRAFLAHDDLAARIRAALVDLDVTDVRALALVAAGIRTWIEEQPFPAGLDADIRSAYEALVAEQAHPDQVTWAVRSSATAEDLPDASFAGQQETFLNISGIENVLEAIRGVYASLYTDRAVVYRAQRGFDEDDMAISAGVQLMVRSDVGASGVMFTIDTESGIRSGRLHHQCLRSRRDGGAGLRQPGRVLRVQAGAAVQGAPRSSDVSWGRRRSRSVMQPALGIGDSTVLHDVDPEGSCTVQHHRR